MRAYVLAAGLLAVGCTPRPTSPMPTAPDEPPVAGTPEPSQPEPQADDEAAADIDFADEAVAPANTIQTQPQRPSLGSFDLCGEACSENLELKKSLEGVQE